jgi:hypothetical protein
VTDVLLSKFSINGAIPLTADNMKEMLEAVVAQMRREIRDAHAADPPALPSLISAPADARFHMWMWGARLHMVPEGWLLPSSPNVKDMWLLWHFGHVGDHIGPLRKLKEYDLNVTNFRAQKTLLSKTRKTMQGISQVMVDMQLVGRMGDVLTLTQEQSSTFFDRAIITYMNELRAGATHGRRRWMEMKIPTIYGLMLKSRKRRREEPGEREEEKERESEGDGEGNDGEEADSVAAALLSQLNG